jgi:hypothetical protein
VTHRLHCLVCDDVRSVTLDRTFCACGRSSARPRSGGIVLVGPGRVFEAGRDEPAIRVTRPAVAIGT